MSQLTAEQYLFLIQPIREERVQHLRGNSHLEAWDIRRHLIRVFGFDGYDIETRSLTQVREIETKKGEQSRWTVVYRAEVRLYIKVNGQVVAFFDGAAAGDATNQPSLGDAHDMAIKTAESQALKRCAINLGDQFGLSLYNDGRIAPVVHRSLAHPELPQVEAPKEIAELGANDEPVRPEPTPVSAPPAQPEPSAASLLDDDPPASGGLLTGEAAKAIEHGRSLRNLRVVGGEKPTETTRKRMFVLFGEVFGRDLDRGKRLEYVAWAAKRQVGSTSELTAAEMNAVIASLEARKAQAAS